VDPGARYSIVKDRMAGIKESTKRLVLASIYLGHLTRRAAPVMIVAKISLDIWKAELDWDEELEEPSRSR